MQKASSKMFDWALNAPLLGKMKFIQSNENWEIERNLFYIDSKDLVFAPYYKYQACFQIK